MRKYFFIISFLVINVFALAQKKKSEKWLGNYSLNFSAKRNYAPEMYWEHNFTISKDFCNYQGTGFQFYTKYKCTAKENKDTLLIYAKIYLDGYENFDKNELIVKIYKYKKAYYTKTIALKPEEANDKQTRFGFKVLKN